ncbi:MAG: hypothetical protein COA42_23560 [Alteromonadaceae bacterium]|nr:MAG: hypothetical protein COA42_23560 [Alteromonadaceae bacterium]
MQEVIKNIAVSYPRLREAQDAISLFGALSEAQMRTLSSHLTVKYCEPGQSVYCQGDQASNIYILTMGLVEMTHHDASGRHVAHEISRGTCFGESALIGIQAQAESARTSTRAELWVLSGQSLAEIYASDTVLFALLMMNIARDVSRDLHGVINLEYSGSIQAA